MQKKTTEFVPRVSFSEMTPEVLIERKKNDPLYEKAFLSGKEKSESEYCQNTTARD